MPAEGFRLQRMPLFEQIALRIEEMILAGELRIGEKLPGEEALAEHYSVSRPVIREALVRLRSDGLTETVSGSGTFVKPIDTDHLARALSRQFHLLDADAQALQNLFEARITVEAATARLAAERASADDLEDIGASLKAMEASKDRPGEWMAGDVGFHMAVAAAARNPFLSFFIRPLNQVMGRGILARLEGQGNAEAIRSGLAAHKELFQAIKDGNSVGAERIMTEHLRHAKDRLTDTLKLSNGSDDNAAAGDLDKA